MQYVITVIFCCCNAVTPILGAAEVQFERDVLSVLQIHCIRFHGPDVQDAHVRLDNLSSSRIEHRAATETWHQVLNVLQASETPTAKEPQLTGQQLSTLTDGVSKSIKATLADRHQSDGRVVLRRLKRVEYQNTPQDLLGMEMDYARDLPPDAVSADGFRNNGLSLQMSSFQLEYYWAKARRARNRVIVHGEQPLAVKHAFTATSIDSWLGEAERSKARTLQENLTSEVERLLADSRAQRFVEPFTDQWLKLYMVYNVSVNRERYPGSDVRLKQDRCVETHAVFALRYDLRNAPNAYLVNGHGAEFRGVGDLVQTWVLPERGVSSCIL